MRLRKGSVGSRKGARAQSIRLAVKDGAGRGAAVPVERQRPERASPAPPPARRCLAAAGRMSRWWRASADLVIFIASAGITLLRQTRSWQSSPDSNCNPRVRPEACDVGCLRCRTLAFSPSSDACRPGACHRDPSVPRTPALADRWMPGFKPRRDNRSLFGTGYKPGDWRLFQRRPGSWRLASPLVIPIRRGRAGGRSRGRRGREAGQGQPGRPAARRVVARRAVPSAQWRELRLWPRRVNFRGPAKPVRSTLTATTSNRRRRPCLAAAMVEARHLLAAGQAPGRPQVGGSTTLPRQSASVRSLPVVS